MTERVSDERLEELASWLEEHAWPEEIGFDTITDSAVLLRELQQRRMQDDITKVMCPECNGEGWLRLYGIEGSCAYCAGRGWNAWERKP